MDKLGLYKLILKRRTVRLFKPQPISINKIRSVINAARCAPSAANLQFLEYLVVDKPELKEKIFPHIKLGGYVYPKRVPPQDKRPWFYIVILINKTRCRKPDLRDVGAAAENILLSLLSFGLAGCWIASVNRRALRNILCIPLNYSIDSIIAGGVSGETPILEEQDKVRYRLDERNRLHVPKRPLEKVFHYNTLNNNTP